VADHPLYDWELSAHGYKYPVQTLSSVDVGEPPDSVVFDPITYTNKGIKMTFTLEQTLGFKLYYSIKVVDHVNDAFETLYTHDQLDSAGLFVSVSDALNPAQTKSTRFLYKEGNRFTGLPDGDFWTPGTEYEITVVASTAGHNGDPANTSASGYLGHRTFAFTMPQPGMPGFDAVVTPYLRENGAGVEDDVYGLQIKSLDFDAHKVIVNSRYKLRIFDANGVDRTPVGTGNTGSMVNTSSVFTADDMPNELLLFEGLQENELYVLRWYAVTNVGNATNQSDVSTLPDSAFLYNNKDFVIYETTAFTTDSHGIYVGRVTAAKGPQENIRLTFLDSAGLGDVSAIQYTVYQDEANKASGMALLTPEETSAGSGVYTVVLPKTAMQPGTYSITLRFYMDNGATYIDQPVSLTYQC
jgi:hypothetical protein